MLTTSTICAALHRGHGGGVSVRPASSSGMRALMPHEYVGYSTITANLRASFQRATRYRSALDYVGGSHLYGGLSKFGSKRLRQAGLTQNGVRRVTARD